GCRWYNHCVGTRGPRHVQSVSQIRTRRMTERYALKLLHDPEAPYPALVNAVAWLCEQPGTKLQDLLLCLDRGGMAAEMAAMRLHELTGRQKPRDSRSVFLTRAEWEHYFKVHRKTAV